MNIFKFLLVPVAAFTLNSSVAQKTVYDANAEVRTVGSFTGVSVSSAIDLYISMGAENAVAVSAKDNALTANITTEVKNGVLYIGLKKGMNSWGPKSIKAYVSIKAINKLEATGACDVLVDGSLNAPDLEIEISGASDFKGEVNAQNLHLLARGSSDFSISGKTTNLRIDVSGSSDVKGYGLVSDNCDIDASGSSDVDITVNKALHAKSSGSSDIRYKGEPSVKDVSSSGSSDIRKVGGQ